jgi:alpha-aminoadipic semialdehyde synthase
VSDISCDVNGSVEFLERSTTIDRPCFQYDPLRGKEVSNTIEGHGITMMGVDILPTELPIESSTHFGNAVKDVLDECAVVKKEYQDVDISRLSPKLVR